MTAALTTITVLRPNLPLVPPVRGPNESYIKDQGTWRVIGVWAGALDTDEMLWDKHVVNAACRHTSTTAEAGDLLLIQYGGRIQPAVYSPTYAPLPLDPVTLRDLVVD